MTKLHEGFKRFKAEVYPRKRRLYRDLASGQHPHTLLLTCADSRVVPSSILQAEPGDLFVCRTVGNQVPSYGSLAAEGVASSVEYALEALGVENIVVCGHSDCGAMKAVMHPEKLAALPATAGWLRNAAAALAVTRATYRDVSEEVLLHLLTEENVLSQLEHLRTYPAVAAKLAAGRVQLHGWVYQIQSGEIATYDARAGMFVPLGNESANATPATGMRANAAAIQGAA